MALILLRDGLDAHLDPDTLPGEPRPDNRLARLPRGHRRLLRLPGPAGRGPCSSGPPRTAGRRPLRPESPFGQQIRVPRSLLDNISLFSPQPPRLAPFQTV